jgi:phage-related protein (TIGR01555 family)
MRLDGYESALLGRRAGVSPTLTRSAVELYALGGLYGRVVDLPADKAVSRGVKIEGDQDSVVANELDRLQVLPALADSLRWSRLTGGAAIVVVANDGGLLRTPLDIGRLDKIEELKVFDLDDISPTEERYSDPTKANFGMPEVYQVRTQASGTVNAEFYVHETRLIPVPGDPLPRRIAAIKGVPWAGRSAVARAYQTIGDYSQSLRWALGILERKQQAVYGMKGLAELIQAQLEDIVQKRIALVDSARNILNTVAIDSEDEYRIEDTNVAGVREIINEFQIALSAETGIPVTVLFGRSPAGQNATGEADFATLHDLVEGLQRNKAGPALERLVALILAQKSVSAKLEKWSIVWPPLESPTEKEAADVRKTNADAAAAEANALNTLVSAAIISEEEGKDYLVAEGKYGLNDEAGDARAVAQYAAQA